MITVGTLLKGGEAPSSLPSGTTGSVVAPGCDNARMASVRAATWNLNNRGPRAAEQLGALAREHGIDLLLLQELNPAASEVLVQAAGLDWIVTAFDAGAPAAGGSGRRRAAAIAGRGPDPRDIGVLPGLELQERAVQATVTTPLGELHCVAYHAPPGVSWGDVKVSHAHALSHWITSTAGSILVGADANTPEVDHPDRDLVRTHWHTGSRRVGDRPGDDVVFGGRPVHGLDDAFRRWLEEHPDEMARVGKLRPTGPLAITHRTGKRRTSPGAPRRFDALWVSPDLQVVTVEHHYDAAMAAGTDHALVLADLTRSGSV